MLLGAGLGLLAAFVIFAGFRHGPDADAPQARTGQPAADSKSRKAPGSRGSDDAERFDFYEVLPHFRVVVPGAKPSEAAKTPAAAVPESPGNYVLQVGSFRALKDADRLQARLALLGIEAQIQHVAVNDATWHRVRVGPSSDLAKMDRIRQRLRNAQISSVLMRVR